MEGEALIPCRWANDRGECLLDGLKCEPGCESYEPKKSGRVGM